jgi:hypothetical protein
MKDGSLTGQRLFRSMESTELFPNMVIQMIAIVRSPVPGPDVRESGRLLRGRGDNAVDALSSLLEPMIMAILGSSSAVLVIAMYLPIFKMASVVGYPARRPDRRPRAWIPCSPCSRRSRGLYVARVCAVGLCVGSFLNVVIPRLPDHDEREWRRQCAELESAKGLSKSRRCTRSCGRAPRAPRAAGASARSRTSPC